jgi:hypothetical protein
MHVLRRRCERTEKPARTCALARGADGVAGAIINAVDTRRRGLIGNRHSCVTRLAAKEHPR